MALGIFTRRSDEILKIPLLYAMSNLPPEMHPDELRALREQIANNLLRLEQLSFARSLDEKKESQVVDSLRNQLDATSAFIDHLGTGNK